MFTNPFRYVLWCHFIFLTILVKFRSIIDGKSTVILVILSPFHSVNNNNNIYFAKRQENQKGKTPPKLVTILRATKQKGTKKQERKNSATITKK